jgi:hypothetical protein
MNVQRPHLTRKAMHMITATILCPGKHMQQRGETT